MGQPPPETAPPNSERNAYLDTHTTPRMQRIAELCLDGRPTWDLCCDHGLIGLWARHVRKLPSVHFVDKAPALIDLLEQRLHMHADTEGLFFHRCDATTLQLGDTPSNIIVAGVGFRASQRIVKATADPQHGHRVIVSVHAEPSLVPPAMIALGWRLAEMVTVEERGRTRIITAWDGARS
ncbi:MAG: tRNA A22 N-methylase [Myxococcota bacterium]|jgi:tRNA A22 N-methylase